MSSHITPAAERPVLYQTDGPLALLTLNRPAKLNALNQDLVANLTSALERAEFDDAIKLVVINGAGDNFSAGYDLSEEVSLDLGSALEWREFLAADVSVTMRIWSFPKPTIAAVAGYCLAGGCELAMACDMIVCAEGSVFGEPEIRYGSGPVTLLMPFVLGQKTTAELLLTGGTISGERAAEVGLVNRLVPLENLDDEVRELAARVVPTPLPVLRLTKQALLRAYEAMGLRAAVAANLELSAILNSAHTPEQLEFDRIARDEGLRAALDWRDERYESARPTTPTSS